jgi:Protein O-mannosyl-transferase TMEM260-like
VTARRALAALALIYALAHAPFLAPSLEDIDSVNFALGVRDFDVATHRPHPPGYPVYIALGKTAKAIARLGASAPESMIEARALAMLSLVSGLFAILCLYRVFTGMSHSSSRAPGDLSAPIDYIAFAATAITAACPLFWYLGVRPMSDLPGLAFALASQACLMSAWWIQKPGPGGDRRLPSAATASSGRLIVIGAFLAALSIGLRSQTVWFTVPLLTLVLLDRVGRGVAGALIGGGIMFVVGGLAWGIPLLIASGGLNAYLAALGTQAGEDFAAGEMLYTNPNPRALAFALLRTFIYPWDSTALGTVVLILAAAGVVQLLWRDRRSLAAVFALAGPYVAFHLLFQDTSFIRYALPLVPVVAFLAVRGVSLVSLKAVPAAAALLSIACAAIASPVLVAYRAEPSPAVRAVHAMQIEGTSGRPGALAMHQTFVRPLEAEEVGLTPQLPSPPRLEWLELAKYWKSGETGSVWFLADPMRSDLALIDPASRRDRTEFLWPLVARPAFGGMRPSAVQWYRMRLPGWFAEEGWSLTPETSGMSGLMGRAPHLAPITAMVRRRAQGARMLIGGRNLAGPNDPAAHFKVSIDGVLFHEWDASPGFFLKIFDIPAGRLSGQGVWAALTVVSTPQTIPTAVEQFDVQDEQSTMWGYDQGWQEAEYSMALGVWRWTSDRATLRIAGPPRAIRITLRIESPLRYFDAAPMVRARAGERELAASAIADSGEWSFAVPADALQASGGAITIETDKTFIPAERGSAPDRRRLGLRVFAIQVSNGLTPAETSR